MIDNWEITNFKVFGVHNKLQFSNINFLAGANSGGKSSLLQSILVLSQSFANSYDNASIQLNGDYVQLGSYDDIVNSKSNSIITSISFDMKFSRNSSARYLAYGLMGKSVHFSIDFSGEDVDTNPEVKRLSIEIASRSDKDNEIYSIVKRDIKTESFLRKKGLGYLVGSIWIENALLYKPSKNFFNIDRFNDEILGTIFEGLRPSKIVVRLNYIEIIKFAFEGMSSPRNVDFYYKSPLSHVRTDTIIFKFSLLNALYKIFDLNTSELILKRRILDKLRNGKQDAEISLYDLLRRFNTLKTDDRIEVASNFKLLLSEIQKIVEEKYTEKKYSAELMDIPSLISNVYGSVESYFSRQIYYLGPLREQPRAVYPIGSMKNRRDIGNKGENTAMAIAINRNKQIKTFVPSEGDFISVSIGFIDAMNAWVAYLGIADSIDVINERQLGYRIVVGRNGVNTDLTHVGVGISQVLPILTTCLLAEKGDTLIFEQPELHLHPKVQSRITDLFINISSNTIQFIIETHSEYIINRLRLYIVQKSILGKLKVYFLSNENSETIISLVSFNEYGVIENWPRDFIDQTDNDIRDLAKAKIEKLRNRG